MRCPDCGGETVPRTRLCLACGGQAAAPATTTAQIAVSAIPPGEADRLVGLTAELVTEPRELVAALVEERGHFQLAGTLAPEQWDRLSGWVTATGARQERSSGFVAGHELTVGWSWIRHAKAKLVAVAAIGGLAAWFSVPLVPAAAVLTIALLVVRGMRVLPVSLTITHGAGSEKLELLDSALLAEVARTRKSLTTSALVESLRAVVVRFVAAVSLLRDGGYHLVDRDLRVVDQRLHQVLRHCLRLAASVDRAADAAERPVAAGAERRARVRATADQVVESFGQLAGSLDALREHLVDLHRAEARRALMSGPLREVWALEGQIEAAAAVAEL